MAALPLWERDEQIMHSHRRASTLTLVNPLRCYMIYQVVPSLADVCGDFAEVGVYREGPRD